MTYIFYFISREKDNYIQSMWDEDCVLMRSYNFCKLNIEVGKNYMEQFSGVWCHSDLNTMASFIY